MQGTQYPVLERPFIITITTMIIIMMKMINSSEGGPYCELGLPGLPEMHTLSMDDFQVIFLIIVVVITFLV